MNSSAGIVLWIDGYNDIFSDFDPRPYAARTVSDDFIAQVKKASHEFPHRPGTFKLLVPEKARSAEDESVIRERLRSFFDQTFSRLSASIAVTRKKGIILASAGFIVLLGASYLKDMQSAKFAITFLVTLFEPAGWFLLWAGFDHFTTISKEKRSELLFYKRMEGVGIEFGSY
ncbi:MAG: hypothetical protein U0U09_00780 [Cyclobacteriaceae bacterium]